MDAHEAAQATASGVSQVASHFMLDGTTYQKGAELGFAGLDLYAHGSGGVLGEVDADVVAAAFAFFEPSYVRSQWEQGAAVMSAAEAAAAWARLCAEWADEHVSDTVPVARLGELLDPVVAAGRPACAAVFAGWRALPVPGDPKAHVVHQMNAVRELRHGLHSAAIVAAGLTPHQALSVRSPMMAPIFGWPDVAEVDGLQSQWDGAEQATDTAIAHAYTALEPAALDELVELIGVLQADVA